MDFAFKLILFVLAMYGAIQIIIKIDEAQAAKRSREWWAWHDKHWPSNR